MQSDPLERHRFSEEKSSEDMKWLIIAESFERKDSLFSPSLLLVQQWWYSLFITLSLSVANIDLPLILFSSVDSTKKEGRGIRVRYFHRRAKGPLSASPYFRRKRRTHTERDRNILAWTFRSMRRRWLKRKEGVKEPRHFPIFEGGDLNVYGRTSQSVIVNSVCTHAHVFEDSKSDCIELAGLVVSTTHTHYHLIFVLCMLFGWRYFVFIGRINAYMHKPCLLCYSPRCSEYHLEMDMNVYLSLSLIISSERKYWLGGLSLISSCSLTNTIIYRDIDFERRRSALTSLRSRQCSSRVSFEMIRKGISRWQWEAPHRRRFQINGWLASLSVLHSNLWRNEEKLRSLHIPEIPMISWGEFKSVRSIIVQNKFTSTIK